MVDIFEKFKDFKTIEIIFKASDDRWHKILCSLKEIEPNKFSVISDDVKNRGLFVPVGDSVKLDIYTEEGVFSAASKILNLEKGIKNSVYTLSSPVDVHHSQRREFFRADLMIKFVMNITIDENKEILFKGITKNISGNGMCFLSDKNFPIHSKIEISLFFKERTVVTEAVLVYSRPLIIDKSLTKFITAFTFPNIEKKDLDFIIKQCFLYQLQLRKKGM